MEASITEDRDAQVPREEIDRVFNSYDQRFQDHQRQLDESKQAQRRVYGTPDVIVDIRECLDRIERQPLSSPPG